MLTRTALYDKIIRGNGKISRTETPSAGGKKMLEKLKREVYEANLFLVEKGLVINTWGNVSGRDPETGLIVIKPSGVDYADMRPSDLPVITPAGERIEGEMRPSSDTPTHLEIYNAFPGVFGVAHTHSVYATVYAQARRQIPPLGTTHADYFPGEVPVTRLLTPAEIAGEYEKNTGLVIVESIQKGCAGMRACLVASHGPFTWGKDAGEAADVSYVLETVARMAYLTETLSAVPFPAPMHDELLDRHYSRKHGPGAYYGQ